MANLLEELILLAYSDDKGRNSAPYLQMSLASGALLDLALSERISVNEHGHIDVVDQTPAGHPALDDVLTRLTKSKTRHIGSTWVQILSGTQLQKPVLEGLVDQGILTYDRDRVLGLIPLDRYRLSKPAVEAELRARLERAFTDRAGVDARTAAIAGVVSATLMETVALPQHKFSAVHNAFTALPEGFAEVKRIVDGTTLAVTVFRSSANS